MKSWTYARDGPVQGPFAWRETFGGCLWGESRSGSETLKADSPSATARGLQPLFPRRLVRPNRWRPMPPRPRVAGRGAVGAPQARGRSVFRGSGQGHRK
eukprot:8111288-Pyramimonas_sp.AAC.1